LVIRSLDVTLLRRLNGLLIIQKNSTMFWMEKETNVREAERPMTEKNTVRCQIVEAAKKRFSHFGYAKTTMAEVAADCSMSPGNLYRFFPGKARHRRIDRHGGLRKNTWRALRKLAVAPNRTARERFARSSIRGIAPVPITSWKRIREPTRWRR